MVYYNLNYKVFITLIIVERRKKPSINDKVRRARERKLSILDLVDTLDTPSPGMLVDGSLPKEHIQLHINERLAMVVCAACDPSLYDFTQLDVMYLLKGTIEGLCEFYPTHRVFILKSIDRIRKVGMVGEEMFTTEITGLIKRLGG